MNDKLRIAMLISGGGTTMREILRAVKSGFLSRVEPVLVIASRSDVDGIEKAITEGVPDKDVLVMRPKWFDSPEVFGEFILSACRERGVDFIGQYGWLPKTPANLIAAFPNMMVNQHPGPLDPGRPDFGGQGMYGRRVHYARLYFVRRTARPDQRQPGTDGYWQHHFTEATCQRVASEFDKGVLLALTTIPINPDDTVETLRARVLPQEHMIQIETLKAFSEGRVQERTRSEPLVREEHYNILAEAKKIAGILYPRG